MSSGSCLRNYSTSTPLLIQGIQLTASRNYPTHPEQRESGAWLPETTLTTLWESNSQLPETISNTF
jgi:hypothetical protein